MIRLGFAGVAVAMMLGLAEAAPVPKDAEVKLYFPTMAGAKWVWEDAVQIVTSVEVKDETYLVKVGKVEGDKTIPVREMSVSPRGVYEIVAPGRELDHQMPWVKVPIRAGESWDAADARWTVVGHEEVEVPAGRFRCVRVDQQWTAKLKSSYWLAPGIGLVKFDPGDGKVETLKSFTPGKP